VGKWAENPKPRVVDAFFAATFVLKSGQKPGHFRFFHKNFPKNLKNDKKPKIKVGIWPFLKTKVGIKFPPFFRVQPSIFAVLQPYFWHDSDPKYDDIHAFSTPLES
jgi:hypothetical protein